VIQIKYTAQLQGMAVFGNALLRLPQAGVASTSAAEMT
jgi:hypothetical protein